MLALTLIANMLKSGTIDISANKENLFRLTATTNEIDINILNKKFVKHLFEDAEKLSSFRHLLASLKNLARDLRNQKTTVTISFNGEKLITMGSDAKPRFSKFLTRTTDIEINSLRKLIKLEAL